MIKQTTTVHFSCRSFVYLYALFFYIHFPLFALNISFNFNQRRGTQQFHLISLESIYKVRKTPQRMQCAK